MSYPIFWKILHYFPKQPKVLFGGTFGGLSDNRAHPNWSNIKAMNTPAISQGSISVAVLDLSPKEEEFAQAVLKWLGNQSAAYRDVFDTSGMSDAAVWTHASNWANRVQVRARIDQLKKARVIDGNQLARDIIATAEAIVTGDRNELIDIRIGACRHCWGLNFLPMYTPSEHRKLWADYAKDLQQHLDKPDYIPEPPMPEDGGCGYKKSREPNPACPECDGEGVTYEQAKDSRKYSPTGRALYGGVKRTKNGLEIMMEDKTAWAEKVLRYVGASKTEVQLTGPGGGPVQSVSANFTTTDPTEAARLYQQIVGKS